MEGDFVNTGLFVAGLVLMVVSLVFLLLRVVFFRVRRRLEKTISQRFKKEEMLGATTKVAFLGEASKGGRQVKGNGALVLTKKALFFIRAIPEAEYEIPISAIRKISLVKSFNGRTVMGKILRVDFEGKAGEDAMGWALHDADRWKTSLEKLQDADKQPAQ